MVCTGFDQWQIWYYIYGCQKLRKRDHGVHGGVSFLLYCNLCTREPIFNLKMFSSLRISNRIKYGINRNRLIVSPLNRDVVVSFGRFYDSCIPFYTAENLLVMLYICRLHTIHGRFNLMPFVISVTQRALPVGCYD